MAKLSEKQRLWLTIGASVALTGGITALIFNDRTQIRETEEEIASLEQRIGLADVEIRKTKDREDEVIVFREVQDRELSILPTKQRIADFHSNLTLFLTQAGARFTKLPENAPKESELTKGVYVTPNAVECEADAGSLLRLFNMIENDERLVAIKGFKVKAGAKPKEPDEQPTHKVALSLETYYYAAPATAKAATPIPNLAERLEDPVIQQRIASFQPEKRDSYKLVASASRRDPFVDVRREVIVEDPEVTRKRFAAEEVLVLDLEKRYDDIREKTEAEKAMLLEGQLFQRDRLGQEVDGLVNELRVRVANVASVKSVTFPDLAARTDKVRVAIEEVATTRKDLPRELKVTVAVAESTRDQIATSFDRGDFADVSSVVTAWEGFVRGKSVEPAAQPILEEIVRFRKRGKILTDFHGRGIHVTGILLNPMEPARSVALVNGKPARVGDALDGKSEPKVVGITREGVDFTFLGETIRVGREDASGNGPSGRPNRDVGVTVGGAPR